MIFNLMQSDHYYLIYSTGIYCEIRKKNNYNTIRGRSINITKRKDKYLFSEFKPTEEDLKCILFEIEKILAVYTKPSMIIQEKYYKESYYNIFSTSAVSKNTIIELCNSVLDYYKDIERKHFKIIDESDDFFNELKDYIDYWNGSIRLFDNLPLGLKQNKEILKEFIRCSSYYYITKDDLFEFLKYCKEEDKAEMLKIVKRFFIKFIDEDLLLKLFSSEDFKIIK